MDEYKITELAKGLWAIDDERGCSMYLVEGREKALLIDTGMSTTPLMPIIRKLTKKPLELAITHAHIDHMYYADEFDTVYMHKNEIKAWHKGMKLCILFSFKTFNLKKKSYRVKEFIPIDEGSILDLGGIEIRVLDSPGHTPGSVTFVDDFHKVLFLGDAVGSGAVNWLWSPESYRVKAYKAALHEFLSKLTPYKEYEFLGGHRMQGVPTEENPNAHPLTIRVVEDMEKLCEKMLLNEVAAENPSKMDGCIVNTYTYGQAAMVQRKSKIR